MARLPGVVFLAILLVGLVACSSGEDRGPRSTDQSARQETEHARDGTSPHRTGDTAEEKVELEPAPTTGATWDYVALGDSLAVGVGARRGYVARYAAFVREDTGARVEVDNLGMSGQTSSQLLDTLRNDPSARRALAGAEVITFNIGINDLGRAGERYQSGTCGGGDGQGCLRDAVDKVERNWDAIVAEILGLRSTNEAVIRTAGLGYTPGADPVFEPYVEEVNRHIGATATDAGIPYAQVRLDEEGMSPDGVHPNDDGYEAIAQRLRELDYVPLNAVR